jgi:egghead protein (zeste-white 4 protein)
VSRDSGRHWYEALAVVVLLPFFGLLEGIGCFRGFLLFAAGKEKSFTVIVKPA